MCEARKTRQGAAERRRAQRALERGVCASHPEVLGDIVRVLLFEVDDPLMQLERPCKHGVHLGLRVTFASFRRRALGLGSASAMTRPHMPGP